MSFESQKGRLEISGSDYDKYSKMDISSPELLEWMNQNNIAFDQGEIPVQIDGIDYNFVTNKEGFGTLTQHGPQYEGGIGSCSEVQSSSQPK